MALVDTAVGVTMICPALVSTGMSSEGVEPSEVAEHALQAVDEGMFALVPSEWQAAVVEQRALIVNGHQPSPPAPSLL